MTIHPALNLYQDVVANIRKGGDAPTDAHFTVEPDYSAPAGVYLKSEIMALFLLPDEARELRDALTEAVEAVGPS
jgi:hypothetical protein